MPVPTDTFWNMKRLNLWFAASSILLVAVTGWTIVQDYGAWWRVPQKDSRVWEAALVEDKIDRLNSPQLQSEIAKNQAKIDEAAKDIAKRQNDVNELNQRIRQLDSQRATIEFPLNVDKANVSVDEAHLQDAITEKNQEEIEKLTKKLDDPTSGRARLKKEQEDLEAVKKDLEERRTELKGLTKAMDDANKARNKLLSDQEGLKKRLDQLQPKSIVARLSGQVRAIPLMGFINPSERVQQVVLDDVLTDMNFQKRVPTLDRCMTCHVNIAKKDFTEEKVLSYLEEQSATAKGLMLPEKWSGVSTDPLATNAQPGAVAMTEFWHAWAKELAPDQFKKSVAKLKTITNTVGKNAKVTLDGRVLSLFTYDPAPAPATQPTTQPTLNAAQNDKVLLTLLDAVLKYDGKTVNASSADGSVQVELSNLATAQVKPIRNASMRYADELRTGLKQSLNPEGWKLLTSRYRFAMVDVVNAERKSRGMALLDPSPVLLAHPRLDLYVDVDSKHSFEAVGCTSCHDGSGQETDFVVTAHVPRDIWVDENTGEPVLEKQLKQPVAEEEEFNLSSMLASAVEHVDSPKITPTTQQSEHLKKLDHAGHEEKTGPIAYIDPVTGKQGKAVTQFKHWEDKYEPLAPRGFHLVYEEWDWPMRKPEFIEVNCARCHSEIYDIKDEAPTLFKGRYLFANLGCSNCHQMDSIPSEQNRKVGTDLRHVTAKLSPAYINTWIWAPKAFRPSTKMPHFFMLENNSSPEEVRRTRLEARAITEYLVKTATPLPPAHPIPEGLKGSADAGQKVFDAIGCMGCHVNLNDPAGTKRPDGKLITRGEQWIVTDMTKKGTPAADARKAYDAMSYNERQAYAMENFEVLPGATEVAKYPDGTPKPQFVHHGPELSGIGTKLTAGRNEDEARAWLFDWLKEPRHYSDYTIMPRLRLSDQQAMDLAEYLLSMKRSNGIENDPWKAALAPADPEKLKELIALQLKSKYTLTTAKKRADSDDELNPMLVDALTTPVVPVDEAKKLAAEITDKDEKRLIILGKKMIANYGCMSCHMINGAETISSPCANLSDWGQKQVSKLDFGYLSEHSMGELPPTSQVPIVNGLSADAVTLAHEKDVSTDSVTVAWPVVKHLRQDWIAQKLKNTRIFDRGQMLKEPDPNNDDENLKVGRPYDKLKMPTFYLNDEQVHAIVTFVLSNRDRLVSERLWKKTTNDKAMLVARGRELVQRYNCVSCHIIETNKPQVQQYFKSDDIMVLAPPSLRGEGNKIQHAWLFSFFKNVIQMRPRIFNTIRMPSFPATDEEWTAIIAYFNQESAKESRELRKDLEPVLKYINEQKAAAGPTTQPLDPTKPWPGDGWFTRNEFAGAAARLREWALTYNQLIDVQLDPKQKPEDLARNYRLALSRALFVMELYDAPYPFVEANTPEVSEERFKLGEQFFSQLQCLACHVLGDPTIEGANKNPTAPNLTLAHLRLQRRWVRHWVQEPDIIQKGTSMPPFFTGLPIYATVTPDAKGPLGQSQPRAQNVAEPQATQIEEKYGKTVQEQTDLLLDFLYAAGARGYTAKQPVVAPTTKPASVPTTKPTG